MDRIVPVFVVVAFILQHFMCCCDGMSHHVCYQDRHAVDNSPATVTHGNCCSHGHKQDRPDSLTRRANWTGTDLALPGNKPLHEHHLCVVAHAFFVQSPKVELLRSVFSTFGALAAECSALDSVAILGHGLPHEMHCSPPLSSQARRAAICVYRI